ncbi:MAG: VTT domain-containing protein [Candidatus Pacebacteria bacterium]|nr:VTT domain-containing protein [Candidatus Paceibacterota bacterium]
MHNLFDITYLITQYGYWGIFIIVFLESGVFFALPGDSLLFTTGLLAASGLLKIHFVIPLIFVSTFFGGIFGFFIGENLTHLKRVSFFRFLLKDAYLNKAHNFFEKHGKSAIMLSRFVPIVRTFTPIIAGVARMKYLDFLRYSLAGSLLWSFIVTLSGYFLGRSFPWIQNYMPIVILVVVFLSVLPAIFEVVKHNRNK